MPYRIDTRAVVNTLADGSFVAVSPNGRVYRGNPTASAMWRTLKRNTADDLADAIDAIAAQYDVPASCIRADVEQFLTDLRAVGLLEIEP